MAIVTTDPQHYAAIASAIRVRSGGTAQYQPSEMPDAILGLSTASGNSDIIVYAPTGSEIILSCGDIVRTVPEDNGVWRFPECGLGSWVVTASKDGLTAKYSVVIEEHGQLMRYEVNVVYISTYGIVRDITSTSPVWTRTDNAVGMTASASVGTVAGHSDFDAVYPWNGIHRETLSTGDVMVKIPRFWYRRYREGDLEYIKIADSPMDGFSLHPAFYHGNIPADAVYVGAYFTSESNLSQSGYKPRASVTLADCRSRARNKGTGWGLLDMSVVSAIQMLYLVEYATYDSQTAVGKGYVGMTSSDTARNTGSTDTVPNLTGVPSGTVGKVDVVYRGMEGIWGNIYQLVDGLIADNSQQKLYVCNQPSSYAQEINSDYTCMDASIPIKGLLDQYVSRVGLQGNGWEYVMFPSQCSGGSASTYTCDAISAGSNSRSSVRMGGRWFSNQAAGMFYFDATRMLSEAHAQNGSRLIYIPPEVRQ